MSQTLTGVLSVLDNVISQAANSSGNTPTLLMIGSFKFSLNTAVFKEKQQSTEYRWASIERFGQTNALQFTGYGPITATLPGVLYPDYAGGTSQINNLKLVAQSGQPQRVITGTGAIAGYWIIRRVTETASYYKPDGTPRKIEFSVSIEYYGTSISQ